MGPFSRQISCLLALLCCNGASRGRPRKKAILNPTPGSQQEALTKPRYNANNLVPNCRGTRIQSVPLHGAAYRVQCPSIRPSLMSSVHLRSYHLSS
ncbi:hypothetical protein B0T11DRAFT_20009 [Plectosphaerella cucumerina]|uniref:Secreted protein n=1 Tax=Plectosphaerella cucumerina TaxID=40658 RepID=A0A8K0TQ39_9PEZI|nr:hypothetical protein B0T11DRAFT_20009 [Plectosphaerella cucumerina]